VAAAHVDDRTSQTTDVVTGAYGYTGRYLAARLLESGHTVRTLTEKPASADPFEGRVAASSFFFDDPARLVESLRGATTLYNTYWVRFPHRSVTYDQAVRNTETLFASALEAGVERVVHVSISSADETSPLPYFHGKGFLERKLRESGLSYAIVRPTVVFGREDILINNIAWLLRKLPVFVIPGDGKYRLQPIYVDDLAGLCAEAGRSRADLTFDAVGPETYTFEQLVERIRDAIESRSRIVHAPVRVAEALGDVLGKIVRDVVITRDEVVGLMADTLISHDPPTGQTSFAAWLEQNADQLGRGYSSELARHYRR
jgi:NADH dehydrogenase